MKKLICCNRVKFIKKKDLAPWRLKERREGCAFQAEEAAGAKAWRWASPEENQCKRLATTTNPSHYLLQSQLRHSSWQKWVWWRQSLVLTYIPTHQIVSQAWLPWPFFLAPKVYQTSEWNLCVAFTHSDSKLLLAHQSLRDHCGTCYSIQRCSL